MAKNDLLIRIAADISSLDKATRTAVSRIQGMASDLNAVGSRLSIGITAPLAALATVALKSAGDMDALRRGLDTVTKSSAETSAQMVRLREIAKLPGLGLQEAVRGSINLQTLGFSAQGAEKIIREFGNALASVGRGREDLEEVIRQLGQMASRGKVTADNLKPIIERVPQAAAIIKREFGTIDTEVLQKMGVSADQFIKTLVNGLSGLPRTTGGIKNDFENLRDSVQQAAAELGQNLIPLAQRAINSAIVPLLQKVSELAQKFRELPGPVQDGVIGIGLFVAAIGPALFAIGQMTEGLLALSKAYTAIKASALLAGAGSTLLRAGPWIALTAALGYTVNSLNQTEQAVNNVAKAQQKQRDVIHQLDADFKLQRYGLAEAKNGHDALLTGILGYVDGMGQSTKVTQENEGAVSSLSSTIKKAAKSWQDAFNEGFGAVRSMLPSFEEAAKRIDDIREMSVRAAESLVSGAGEASLSVEALNANLAATQYAIERIADPAISDIGFAAAKALDPVEALSVALKESMKINLPDDVRGRRMETDINAAAEAIDKGTKKAANSSDRFSRQVSLIVNDLSRDITDLIFKGGKLKDVLVGTFENIGKALVRSALESSLKRILGLVVGLIDKIPGLSKVTGAVFGGGASAAGGAVGAAGSAGGAAASAGGGAASGAASGLLGYVGVGAAVASAVSGVIGNFQMAGMNKSLDLIVNHTLRTANQLIEGLQPQVNRYLPYLEMIHQRLIEFGGLQGQGLAAQGGASVTVNFYGSNGDYDRFIRELKLRGALK